MRKFELLVYPEQVCAKCVIVKRAVMIVIRGLQSACLLFLFSLSLSVTLALILRFGQKRPRCLCKLYCLAKTSMRAHQQIESRRTA